MSATSSLQDAVPMSNIDIHKLSLDEVLCVCDVLDIRSVAKLSMVCKSLCAALDFYITLRVILWEKSEAPSSGDNWVDKPDRHTSQPHPHVIVHAIKNGRDVATIERIVRACQHFYPALLADTFLPSHWWQWTRYDSPLLAAATRNRVEVIEMLEEYGADINVRFNNPSYGWGHGHANPLLDYCFPSDTGHLSNVRTDGDGDAIQVSRHHARCCWGLLDQAISRDSLDVAEYLLARTDLRVYTETLFQVASINHVAGSKVMLASGRVSKNRAANVLIEAVHYGPLVMSADWVEVILSLQVDPYRKVKLLLCHGYCYPQRSASFMGVSSSIVQQEFYTPSPDIIFGLLKAKTPRRDELDNILHTCVCHSACDAVTKCILEEVSPDATTWIKAYLYAIESEWKITPKNGWRNDLMQCLIPQHPDILSKSDLNQTMVFKGHRGTVLEHAACLLGSLVKEVHKNIPDEFLGPGYKATKRLGRFYVACWEWITPLLEMGADENLLSLKGQRNIEREWKIV
ncbi:hypothetical protein F5Y16DRAFT_393952 [Xylariaceae sp. FL0255]|nr:hypothetical protein F5Y16DRAFT_393952 [Xylariaceae sp. FL0255]